MNNDKVMEELLARIQTLEEKVDALSKQIPGATTEESSEGKEKRCLPGFNSCNI